MQRQAVPLLMTEAPVVGTGMETKAAVDSGVCVVAEEAGVVERSASTEIIIRQNDGKRRNLQADQVSSEATRATAITRDRSYTKGDRSGSRRCNRRRPVYFQR